MKVKKMLTIWTLVLCSIVFFASVSNADPKWQECNVLEVGLSEDGGTYIIRLERSSGSRRSYEIPSGELNRCLSIALTAASAGMEVLAYVDWADTTGTGDLVGLKLKNY
jgi:hypothetical protein